MHTFICALSTKSTLNPKLCLLLLVSATHCYSSAFKECAVYVVIAIHTDNFFCDIRIIFHILSVCRNLDSKLIAVYYWLEVKVCKDSNNIFIRNCDTKNSVNLLDRCLHLFFLKTVTCVNVYVCLGDLTTTKLLNKVKCSLHSHNGCVLVYALRECCA